MERYAIIIRQNEEMALLHCYHGDSLDLKTLQEIVEGHIETVPTALAGEWSHEQGVGLTLIINEEGKLLGTTDEDFIGLTERAAQNIMKKWELGVC